ncbi:MAG: DUF3990 domain-containing protein [Victivallales bacterium]|nr:DUF3990 domain-containing protein [Victivallales bacterium]MBO7621944.1 DUF3990 domain-containing protein [Victivallales bacterium]
MQEKYKMDNPLPSKDISFNGQLLFHGSLQIVRKPEIRIGKYAKDFSIGFYCTYFKEQAVRWATRFPAPGYVNIFSCKRTGNLLIKRFDTMTEEWLDFIVACRHGDSHDFDIVEGPMANDTIFNYIQDFMDGNISREAFWALAKFKRPTHQICFHTQKALDTLTFEGYEIYGN